MFLRYLLHFDYLNMFLKSLCLRSMLSFCLSNYLAVQSEIIVRMAQMIGMKTNAILKLPMLNHALSRTCNGQSMGNGTRNALTSGERINTQLQNATQHSISCYSHMVRFHFRQLDTRDFCDFYGYHISNTK